jgi:hypothetical protein
VSAVPRRGESEGLGEILDPTLRALSPLLCGAVEDVLAELGLRVSYAKQLEGPPISVHERIVSIAFGAECLHGSLVVSAPISMLIASNPAGARDPDAQADWLGELANMLLGRFKRRLTRCGVIVNIGTPCVVLETDLAARAVVAWRNTRAYIIDDATLYVGVEAIATGPLLLAPSTSAAEEDDSTADVTLF